MYKGSQANDDDDDDYVQVIHKLIISQCTFIDAGEWNVVYIQIEVSLRLRWLEYVWVETFPNNSPIFETNYA